MKRSAIILSALLMAALLLVGCGQKGPLYLPDDTNDSATEQEG
ncbi:MAG: lipoprotein [Halomonas sp.]|jgi:predicted small lipoprotein YifL|nr:MULTISPECIES: lipoprotein [Halomonas]MCD1650615.1 lipoprotein [Halomonas axialensis]MCD2086628.1 lipoprotein [Halomonas meridiana]MDC8442646.1 lipoprotein [Halomonas aquamarina]NQY77976.1 lipoprotein [Halomonas sp.]|tara:strand:+ start:450 stop:578 length:129 start_codon:yes stop_codon:yes gene_type:complete